MERIVYMLHDVAKGVAYLHRLNIVHRDIKPANVLTDKHYRIFKVADFGISILDDAKVCAADYFISALQCEYVHNARMAQNRGAGGTRSYMAPEAEDPLMVNTAAIDVFSFGVMACQMLCYQV